MTTTRRSTTHRTARLALPAGGAALLITVAAFVLLRPLLGGNDGYAPPTTLGDRAPLRVGEAAPDFTLPNAAGEPVSLHEYRGKPTIFVFFRTFG